MWGIWLSTPSGKAVRSGSPAPVCQQVLGQLCRPARLRSTMGRYSLTLTARLTKKERKQKVGRVFRYPSDGTMEPLIPQPSRQSLLGLDWLNFFLADVRTGVGPFVAIYLASQHWNQEAVGIALTVGGLAGVLSQAPGGAVVDRVRSKRLLIGFAILTIALGALILAVQPSVPFVLAAQLLTGVVSGVLGPSIAAVTVGLVGHSRMAERIGRNHRFDSAGNVVAAAVMGLVGYLLGNRAIFYLAAGLALPTLLTLSRVRGNEIDYDRARGGVDHG